MIKVFLISIIPFLLIPILASEVEASNPNLFVSAENSNFINYFEGSMVVEVVIIDNNIRDTDQGKGEPNVTINGKQLRMVQGSDGQWYAYFAHVDAAKTADQIVLDKGVGAQGQSLDFGVFCDRTTSASVLGVSFSNTVGVAIPRKGGISGSTDGSASFNACTGSPTSSMNLNNVVRESKAVNTNSNVPPGQIGIDVDAWPVIQLFSFGNVEIKYNKGGGPQFVELEYDQIPNISLNLDRSVYPTNAEVFVTINDIQLNQDPTDEDSWTFNINSPTAVFYQAFDENGQNAGNGGPGLIDLFPRLSDLEFDNNGFFTMNLGSVAELQTNDYQPANSVTDGTTTYSQIVTFVESETSSGIFENFDFGNESTIGILADAPRGQSAIISYNKQSLSILTGTFEGSIVLGAPGTQLTAGTKNPISVNDPDQNINPGSRDTLEIFKSSSILPTLQIGNPVTLEKTSNVKIYSSSFAPLGGGTPVSSSVPDKISKILVIDTTATSPTSFEKISMNLGITAGELQTLFIDDNSSNQAGTNWLNFDLRSFEKQLEINSFSDTSMTLHFGGLPGTTSVTILDPGDISSAIGFVEIDNSDIATINTVSSSSSVFLEINFDSSNNTSPAGSISNEDDTQPIVFDLFSFGEKNNQEINNAIYRLELEETTNNSGKFSGTIQYTIATQLSTFDANLIRATLRTIDDQIHYAVTNRMIDNEGISIQYSDVQVGAIIPKSLKFDINTNSGVVTTKSSLRFGHPVTITLNDPDLNIADDIINIYTVNDDPNSPLVDTVADTGGGLLMEILIKDIRYERCTIDGKEFGGLASTGFSLIETGTNTGIFEGTFKMPTEFCNKTGTKLITTAGGSIDAKYHDFRDSSGNPNIFSLSRISSSITGIPPTLNSEQFILPKYKQTADVILTGKLDNYKQGTSLQLTLIGPDETTEELNILATRQGEYTALLTLYHNSQPGIYNIAINYLNSPVATVFFEVIKHQVPEWIKNNARWWSTNQISDSEFIGGIEHLIKEDIITIPESLKSQSSVQEIPSWIKNTAKWWSEDSVTDDEFLSALEFLVKSGIIRI